MRQEVYLLFRSQALFLSLGLLASTSSLCPQNLLARRKDGSIKSILEPLKGILLGDSLTGTNGSLLSLLEGNTAARATEHYVQIHTVDTNARIVLDTKIDVLIDTKTEVSLVVEVAFLSS